MSKPVHVLGELGKGLDEESLAAESAIAEHQMASDTGEMETDLEIGAHPYALRVHLTCRDSTMKQASALRVVQK